MTGSSRMEARLSRIESRLDRVAHDVDVLKTDVSALKTDVSVLKTDVSVLKTDVSRLADGFEDSKELSRIRFEHVDGNFKVVAERFQGLSEQMERGFAAARRERQEDMAFLRQVLDNHEHRITALERPSHQ
jgi:chromosome segregation ATPase